MPRGAPRLRTKDDKLNRVGSQVYERRGRLKLTQDVLCARLADVTRGAWIPDRRDIFRIERGRRIVSDLEVIALALVLECGAEELLSIESLETEPFKIQE